MIAGIFFVLSYIRALCYTISTWHVVINLLSSLCALFYIFIFLCVLIWLFFLLGHIRQSHPRLSKTSHFKPNHRQISRRCSTCYRCYSNSQEQSISPSLLSDIHTSRLFRTLSICYATSSILLTFPCASIWFIRVILRWTWTSSETLRCGAPQLWLALGVRCFLTFQEICQGLASIFWTEEVRLPWSFESDFWTVLSWWRDTNDSFLHFSSSSRCVWHISQWDTQAVIDISKPGILLRLEFIALSIWVIVLL